MVVYTVAASGCCSMHDVIVVLAHQGGWDEVLLVPAPISLFAVLVYVANKRAARLAEEEVDG
jgi:hypothetical protein